MDCVAADSRSFPPEGSERFVLNELGGPSVEANPPVER
jgi:hypothetical protein